MNDKTYHKCSNRIAKNIYTSGNASEPVKQWTYTVYSECVPAQLIKKEDLRFINKSISTLRRRSEQLQSPVYCHEYIAEEMHDTLCLLDEFVKKILSEGGISEEG